MATTMILSAQPPAEALPAYSRRDPETSSILSSAPSYVSEAPTYRSTLPQYAPLIPGPAASSRRASPGLPPPTYAPGFHRAAPTGGGRRPGDVSAMRFDIAEWSAARGGLQARHYEAVARRRAVVASEDAELSRVIARSGVSLPSLLEIAENSNAAAGEGGERPCAANMASQQTAAPVGAALFTSVSAVGYSPSAGLPVARHPSAPDPAVAAAPLAEPSAPSTTAAASAAAEREPPLSPLEDPDLVGEVAARAARERRLEIARVAAQRKRDSAAAAALRVEERSWDFMLAQMAAWEANERSWERFRRNARAKKGIRRFFR